MIARNRFGLNRMICPSLDMKDFFQLANDLELKSVELRNDLPGKKIIDDYSPQEINDLAGRYDIQICSINALQQFNNFPEIERVKKELHLLLNLAEEIHCQAIVMCPLNKGNQSSGADQQYRETVKSLIELASLFKSYGVEGYLEPLGFKTSSLFSILAAMKAIQEAGHQDFKIVYDTFHHAIGPDDLKLLDREYDMQYTGLIHVSAVTADIPPEQYRDEHRNMDFQRDRLESKEQVELFLQRGYQGIISFEPFAKEIQQLDKQALMEKIDQSIEYLCH